MLGIPGQLVFITVVLCGGVGIMLNRKDVVLMIATGIMIIIATELFIWAITGSGVLYR